jgi:hypothetical protein
MGLFCGMLEAEPTLFQGANRTTTSKAAGPQKCSKLREEQEAHEENKCCRNFGCEGSIYVLEANGLSQNQ